MRLTQPFFSLLICAFGGLASGQALAQLEPTAQPAQAEQLGLDEQARERARITAERSEVEGVTTSSPFCKASIMARCSFWRFI